MRRELDFDSLQMDLISIASYLPLFGPFLLLNLFFPINFTIINVCVFAQGTNYELAEVAGESKERRLSPNEKPVSVMLLWPLPSEKDFHR